VLLQTATVVFGDAANAPYQGQPLGNLHTGSNSSQLEQHVDKTFLGLDHPQTSSWETHRPVSGTRSHAGARAHGHSKQGDVGDCSFVAALGAVVRHIPDDIRQMFSDNGDGTFAVRFCVNGAAKYVTVDRALPTTAGGREVYATFGGRYDDARNELWVAL